MKMWLLRYQVAFTMCLGGGQLAYRIRYRCYYLRHLHNTAETCIPYACKQISMFLMFLGPQNIWWRPPPAKVCVCGQV